MTPEISPNVNQNSEEIELLLKKLLLLLFLTLISFNSYGWFGKTVCVATDTQIRNDLYYLPSTTKPFSGKDLCKNENGQIITEGKVKKGKFVSRTKYLYYENGQKWYEGTYKDDKDVGEWTYWHKNGQKYREGTYKDDMADGKYTEWYENGQKYREGNYKDGKRDGNQTTWSESDQIMEVSTYKDGVCISGVCD